MGRYDCWPSPARFAEITKYCSRRSLAVLVMTLLKVLRFRYSCRLLVNSIVDGKRPVISMQ